MSAREVKAERGSASKGRKIGLEPQTMSKGSDLLGGGCRMAKSPSCGCDRRSAGAEPEAKTLPRSSQERLARVRQSHKGWPAFSTETSDFRKPVEARVLVRARRARPLRDAARALAAAPQDALDADVAPDDDADDD
jgi:hypothetical protein